MSVKANLSMGMGHRGNGVQKFSGLAGASSRPAVYKPGHVARLYRWAAHTALVLLLTATVFLCPVRAQSSTTPAGNSPGSPAGSYLLSKLETLSLYSGKVNAVVPLVKIGGRGDAGYTMMFQIDDASWTTHHETHNGASAVYLFPEPMNIGRAVFLQDFEFGIVTMRYTGADPGCPPPNDPDGPPSCYKAAEAVMVFTEADGTEHPLYDEVTGGLPSQLQHPYNTFDWQPTVARGLTFSSRDGSGLTFVADPPPFSDQYYVKTQIEYDPSSPNFLEEPVSGYLKKSDGTVIRFVNARTQWIRDRNGNLTTFQYQSTGNGNVRLTQVVDSNNRSTDIVYGTGYKQIVYTGAHNQTRTITVNYASLQNSLLPNRGYAAGPIYNIFPANHPAVSFANRNDVYNPSVASTITMPDQRTYSFRYNSHGELARIESPSGGAVEYEHGAGLQPDPNNPSPYEACFASGQVGAFTSFPIQPPIAIYRRLLERREYANGGTTPTLVTTYTRFNAPGIPSNVREVQTDPATSLAVARRDHYFHGLPTQGLMAVVSGLSGLSQMLDGREYKTETLALDSDTALSRTEHEWVEGCLGTRASCAANNGAKNWSPFIKTTTTSIRTASGQYRVAKSEFTYDVYSNLTDTHEYHYGTGQPGALARHTHTDFAGSANLINGQDYSTFDIHLWGLPIRQQVFDAVGTERSRTTYEYDNYTTDAKHAGLVARSNISGLCTTYNTSGQCSTANSTDYKTRGNVTAVTSHLLSDTGAVTGSLTAYAQFDVAGNIVKSIDRRGHESTVVFQDRYGTPNDEARGNNAPQELGSQMSYAYATLVTNSLGHETYTQYDYDAGLPVNVEDPNGMVSSTAYNDPLDRPTQVIRAIGTALVAQTTTEYHDAIHTVTVTSDLNSHDDNLMKAETVYDEMGRVTQMRSYENSGAFITRATTYDALGRIKTTSNPYRSTSDPTYGLTTTNYDAQGRVQTVIAPDGTITQSDYDGTKLMVTDASGSRRVSDTNALGQLIDLWEVTSSEPTTVALSFGGQSLTAYLTHYDYDALGNLKQVTQGVQTRSYVYDSLSRLTSATNPESGTIQYKYDANGNPVLKIDPRTRQGSTTLNTCSIPYDGGQVASCTEYDSLNRVASQKYNDGTPDVSYAYDAPAVNAKGRLTSVSSSVATYDFTSYDVLGRIKSSTQSVDGVTYSMPDYRYDLAGHLTSEQYPSGKVVATEYDAAGRVAGVKNDATDMFYAGSDAADANNRMQYAAHGPAEAVKLGNTLWEHSTFNNRLQPTQIALGTSGTDTSVFKLDYTYGMLVNGSLDASKNNGNVQSQTITTPGMASTLNLAYVYDPLNRLTSARETKTSNGQETWKQAYTYLDAANQNGQFGNRRLDPSGTTANVMPASNPTINPDNNRYNDGQGYGYDVAGNLTTAPGHTYQYDAEARMKTLDGGATPSTGASYFYDGQGRRVKKVEPARVTVYIYNAAGRLVAEYSNYISGTGTKYLTQDALKSTRVVTQQNGAVESRHDYMPFGEEINVNVVTNTGREAVSSYNLGAVTRKFATYERDLESGLDYALNRYYSSPAGRFTSPDPTLKSVIGLNPQTLNRYAYVVNNPLLFVDPHGLWGIFFKQITDDDGKFKKFEIYLVKTQKGDNATTLVKQLGFSNSKEAKDLEKKIDKMIQQGGEVRGSELGGIIGRTYNAAEIGLTQQTRYDLDNPKNKYSKEPLGGANEQYNDCSMTSCRIAFPMNMIGKVADVAGNANFGIDDANAMLSGRKLKDGDNLRVGDIVRYGKEDKTHFVNILFIDDDNVTQVFSRSGVKGVFETLRVDEPKIIQGYGPVTGKFRP